MNRPAFRCLILIALLLPIFHLHAQYRIWKQIDGLYGGNVRNIAFGANGDHYVATEAGIYRSIDKCRTWSPIPPDGNSPGSYYTVFAHPSGAVLASSGHGLYYSTDHGSSWKRSQSVDNVQPRFVDATGRIFGYVSNKGLRMSTDAGKTWSSFGKDTLSVTRMCVTRQGTWFISGSQGMYRSGDAGLTWKYFGLDDPDMENICEMKDGTLFIRSGLQLMSRPKEDGARWSVVPTPPNENVELLFIDRNNRIIMGSYSGIFVSTDRGATWRLAAPLTHKWWNGWMTQDAAGKLYAGSYDTGLYSSDDASVWVQSIAGIKESWPILLCESHSGALFATAGEILYVSRDDGNSWSPIDVNNAGFATTGAVDSHGHIFLSGWYGILRSTDDGLSWTLLNKLGTDEFKTLHCTDDNVLIGAMNYGEMFESLDEGEHWIKVKSETDKYQWTWLVLMPDGSFVTNRYGKILRSRDKGYTWEETGSMPENYRDLIAGALNGSLLAATSKGLFMSSNWGASWKELKVSQDVPLIDHVLTDEYGSIYAVYNRRIFQSTNDGTNWTDVSEGIQADFVSGIRSTSKGYVFATTQSNGLYRTITTVKPRTKPERLPEWSPNEYVLAQNFPNPFNPTTTIAFALPSTAFVSLKIFNSLGQEVAEVVSQELPAGIYSRQWNASGMPSGVYFYRLRAGGYTETKRLVMLR
jgi:photosystem II stability/assembly factor-like uncharacterized protein